MWNGSLKFVKNATMGLRLVWDCLHAAGENGKKVDKCEKKEKWKREQFQWKQCYFISVIVRWLVYLYELNFCKVILKCVLNECRQTATWFWRNKLFLYLGLLKSKSNCTFSNFRRLICIKTNSYRIWTDYTKWILYAHVSFENLIKKYMFVNRRCLISDFKKCIYSKF